MRTIAAVTVGRSDWGLYRPILERIREEQDLRLHLIASGAHFTVFGSTVNAIRDDGYQIDDQVDMLLSNDSPEAVAKSMGLAMTGFAQVYQRVRPEMVLVLGDRFEMHAAAAAAVPFDITLAHVHGGEVTNGAIDDAFRHAITKYSHLHFVSTEAHARRVIQLGEEPWRVTVSGAPGLDNLHRVPRLTHQQLEQRLSLSLPPSRRPLLVTFHPVTLQHEQASDQAEALLAALRRFNGPIVITKPNADTRGQQILQRMEAFAQQRPEDVRLVDNLGTQAFFSLMASAAAMVGNSSSGIIEAASFHLPTVNIGLRQHGRARSGNVIDVDCRSEAIAAAIEHAISPAFRKQVAGVTNIYGDGGAAERIVNRLRTEPLNERLRIKRFYDLPDADRRSQAA